MNKWRVSSGYLAGLLGVAVLTIAIAAIRNRVGVPNLSLVYLLLVLWLGARFGIGPAVAASVLSFLAYDFFIVAPVGTLGVAGLGDLFGLLLLLAAALVTGRLAASAREAQARAMNSAEESRSLYELATASLKLPLVETALELVSRRANQLSTVDAFTVIGSSRGGLRFLSGDAPGADSERKAKWSFEHRSALGIQLDGTDPHLMEVRPAKPSTAFLPLRNGVVIIRHSGEPTTAGDRHMLGALVSLTGLLVDRWVGEREAEYVRSLAASDQLKSAVLSSISHELKSPIAVLRAGLSSLAVPQAQLRDPERELVLDLDRQAAHLDRLITDLLTMSRLEAGMAPRREPASLAELAGAVVARLRPRLGPRKLRTDIPEDLPPVLIDEAQVDSVLTNVLENAIEWSPEHGEVSLSARLHDGELWVAIENDGAHVPPVDLSNIFDKFWSRRTGGSGLGLAISKRIVEAHGGSIRAHNSRRGFEVVFTLPVAAIAQLRPT